MYKKMYDRSEVSVTLIVGESSGTGKSVPNVRSEL